MRHKSEELAARVVGALKNLGWTADDVAATLRAAGVRGTPRDPQLCPVARKLAADLGLEEVMVGDRRTFGARGEEWASVETPIGARSFLYHFDNEFYKDLELV